MKSVLPVLVLSLISFCLLAQQNDCEFYIQAENTRKKVRQSLYPLDFGVSESIVVSVKIHDKGKPGIIEFVFDFEDTSGLPVELGSTLTIKFTDHTAWSIIASTRKVKSSIVYFTISDTGSRTTTTNHSKNANLSLTEKLSKIDIRSFEIYTDYKQREILVAETKAVIIKKTILCLL